MTYQAEELRTSEAAVWCYKAYKGPSLGPFVPVSLQPYPLLGRSPFYGATREHVIGECHFTMLGL